jgi:hypothetical protein
VLPMCCVLRVVTCSQGLSVLYGCLLAPFCSLSAAFAAPPFQQSPPAMIHVLVAHEQERSCRDLPSSTARLKIPIQHVISIEIGQVEHGICLDRDDYETAQKQ